MPSKKLKLLPVVLPVFLAGLTACGGSGGGSGPNGLVVRGTLIQGEGSSHARISPKHSASQPIEEVEICGLGSCSRTDALGGWGFLVEGGFVGGEADFTIVGHGIDAHSLVNLPAGAEDLVLALEHHGGTVSAKLVSVDGVELSHDDEHEHGE